MNPIKVFLSIFAVGIGITIILGVIGYPEGEDAARGPAEEVAVEDFVKQSCIGCHGADLKGGAGAPALVGITLSKEQIIDVLTNGAPGGMPAGLAKGREAEVAEYLLSLGQ